MTRTFIAFIECVFDPKHPPKWQRKNGFPHEIMSALEDEAEISLVTLNETRRYFSFKRHSEVHIVNNVIHFDPNWAEELAIDEDKQFPKQKRIDE